ncbi:YgjV family protein [Methylomonas sp. AM2-LC]|uniref:YgjV family protein n=1 Tax=Methylomonas sp. AM2-LC TaxID=3153301 RepID=UPI0032663F62
MNLLTLAYIVGGVGVIFEWYSYLSNRDLAFRYWSTVAALFWAIQYCLLGAWTAGLTMGLTALRTLSSGFFYKKQYKNVTFMLFSALFVMLAAISWQGIISLLPAFAVLNTTLALFYLTGRNMRMILLASSLAWIGNDLYWHAWFALLAECVAVGLNLRTIRRFCSNV